MVSCRTVIMPLPKKNTKHTVMLQERSQDHHAPRGDQNTRRGGRQGTKYAKAVRFYLVGQWAKLTGWPTQCNWRHGTCIHPHLPARHCGEWASPHQCCLCPSSSGDQWWQEHGVKKHIQQPVKTFHSFTYVDIGEEGRCSHHQNKKTFS